MRSEINARPHPYPLPRREGTATRVLRNSVRRDCYPRVPVICSATSDNLNASESTRDGQAFHPLPGERARVRAVVTFPN
jgi:hypothetical protein